MIQLRGPWLWTRTRPKPWAKDLDGYALSLPSTHHHNGLIVAPGLGLAELSQAADKVVASRLDLDRYLLAGLRMRSG